MDYMNKKSFAYRSKFVFYLFIFVAGIYGAYTLVLRGGMFCNAQTANMSLLGIGIAKADINQIVRYFLLIFSFILGCIISEVLLKMHIKNSFFDCEHILVMAEIISVIVIGLLGEKLSDFFVQITICFLCSMQFYIFRDCEGIQIATIFSTNNIRQFMTYGAKYIRKKRKEDFDIMCKFGCMLLFFIFGSIACAFCITYFSYKAILISIPALILIFLYISMK